MEDCGITDWVCLATAGHIRVRRPMRASPPGTNPHLSTDFQLRVHSHFVIDAMRCHLLQSFAEIGTARRLAVIARPLDEGLSDWPRLVAADDCVVFVEGGVTDALLAGAAAVVNSTVGLGGRHGRGEDAEDDDPRRRRFHLPGRSGRFLAIRPARPGASDDFCVLSPPDVDQAWLSHPHGAGSSAAGICRAAEERPLAARRRIDDIVRDIMQFG